MKKLPALTEHQKAIVLGDKPLAFEAIRQQSPLVPINFLDMIEIIASELRGTWDAFYRLKADIEEAYRAKPPGTILSEDQNKSLTVAAKGMADFANAFGFREACVAALNVRDQVEADDLWSGMRRSPSTVEIVADLMDDFDQALRRAMAGKKLVFIAPEKEKFLEKLELFGPLVNQAFPEATSDVKEAGNCLVFDLNTAAVFHLMRIAEFGLRKMAKRLRTAVSASRIDFAGWSTLTKKIRKRIEVLEKRTNNAKKLDDLEYYHAALDEIKFFRDYWRNEVMHTRGQYDATQADDARKRVENFMRKLALRILKK